MGVNLGDTYVASSLYIQSASLVGIKKEFRIDDGNSSAVYFKPSSDYMIIGMGRNLSNYYIGTSQGVTNISGNYIKFPNTANDYIIVGDHTITHSTGGEYLTSSNNFNMYMSINTNSNLSSVYHLVVGGTTSSCATSTSTISQYLLIHSTRWVLFNSNYFNGTTLSSSYRVTALSLNSTLLNNSGYISASSNVFYRNIHTSLFVSMLSTNGVGFVTVYGYANGPSATLAITQNSDPSSIASIISTINVSRAIRSGSVLAMVQGKNGNCKQWLCVNAVIDLTKEAYACYFNIDYGRYNVEYYIPEKKYP